MPHGDEARLNIGRLIRVGSVFNLRAWLFGKCCAGASSCDGPRFSISGEQVRAALRQFHKRAAVVQLKPATFDRQIKAGRVVAEPYGAPNRGTSRITKKGVLVPN